MAEFLYGVRTRRVASAGLDGLTPIILLAFVLLMLGAGVYSHVQLSKLAGSGQPTMSTTVLWTSIIVGIVALFAVVGPMVLLGVFAASKIMKFPLSGAAYLKACAVAALPLLLLRLTHLLPPNLPLRVLAVIAILPLVFFVVKATYELTIPEGAVAFVISGITGIIGLAIAALIIGAVAVGGTIGEQMARQGGGFNANTSVIPPVPGVRQGTSTTSPPTTPTVQTKSPEVMFRDTLLARVDQTSDASREQQQKELADLKAQAQRLGVAGEAHVVNMIDILEKRAAAAPSEQPEATLFQEPAVATAWRPSEGQLVQLAPDEISYKNFNLRLPKGFRVDLASAAADAAAAAAAGGDDEKGMSFSTGRPDSPKLTLRTVPATNARQRRPWVTTQRVQSAAAQRDKLFTIDGSGGTSDEGTINGMAFTRVVHEPGKRSGVAGRSAQYATRTHDGWLVAEAVAPFSSGEIGALESAIRTLRPRPAGDPVIDPLAPDALVAHLAEDPDRVAALLRAKGKAAEDAVIPQLKHADPRAARAAASVLADIGTEKSLPALQEAAKARDASLAEAARAAIKRLKPDTLDAVAEALLDLEGGDVFRKREALERLATVKPAADDPRREKIATILEALCLGSEGFHLGDWLDDATAAWAGKQTVPRLAATINDQRAPIHQRHLIMDVLAKARDERGVFPVVRWLIWDTEHAQKSLIEMGSVAETEVIKVLKDANPTARTAAARILQEIGTARSLATLKRASLDQRDAGAAAAARVALDIVGERVKAAKESATTAPAR